MSLKGNRNYAILLSGQVVSTFGNNLFSIALPWYVYALTNSKSDLALTGLAQTLPAVVGLFAGVLVDRWAKRATMMGSDLVRAALSLVLFTAVLLHWPFWTILAMVLGLQVAGQFFGPASSALFPMLMDPEDIAAGTGISQSANATAQLAGTVSGGALLASLGAPLLFLLDFGTFLVSVASLFFIRVKERAGADAGGAHTTVDADARGRWQGFVHDWLYGFHLVRQSRFLMLILLAALVTNGALAPFDIAITAWVKGPMHGTSLDLGLINGGFFVGAIAGGVLLGKTARRLPLRTVLVLGLVVIGACCGCFGLLHNVIAEIALGVVAGFASGNLNGALSTEMIRMVPVALRGRIFGLTGALSTFAMPVGMAGFGALMVHVPLPVVFAVMGSLAVLAGLALLMPVPDDKHRLAEEAGVAS
ncbi:MAG: MFS transporter [Alicyclobacillus sp.]|nr:MFS transporter [Alicyclobacillus sp.]